MNRRLVIPTSMRSEILKSIYMGHMRLKSPNHVQGPVFIGLEYTMPLNWKLKNARHATNMPQRTKKSPCYHILFPVAHGKSLD